MSKCLILYSTTDGHTKKICDRIAHILNKNNNTATTLNLATFDQTKLNDCDSIIIGASIRYGKHQNSLYNFISQNKEILENKKNSFFTVNVVARKMEKNSPETNPYMKNFLDKSKWKPQSLSVFAGKIEYPKYGFIDKYVIRFIMWISKGPTDTTGTFEFTDWQKVDDFANKF
jgi:menaquinone-dependent protoporphyrinogen oxidase|tara:strand:+ start:1248 stop:1766 length:519 start_codon:yes stop_codon:yes gene_type:complete